MTGQSSAFVYHPRVNEQGKQVKIQHPTAPSPEATWKDPTAVAVFVPDGPVPSVLNGVPVVPGKPPSTVAAWAKLVRERRKVNSRPAVSKSGKKISAGAVIVEPDGRVWLCEPTNHFGGYQRTFPKGTLEAAYSLETIAAREVFEETGLLVEIGDFLVDCERDLSVARYFLARRIAGTPSGMGWESQAVWLVPMAQLQTHAPHQNDAPIVQAALDTTRPPLVG